MGSLIVSCWFLYAYEKVGLGYRYIAKTLFGGAEDEEDDDASDNQSKNVEPPKLLGLNPISKEKVLSPT